MESKRGMKNVELILRNKSSQINKDLCVFLERNLPNIIVKGNIRFKFILSDSSNIDELKNKGISRLPVLISSNGKHIVGTPDIISYLNDLIKNSKSTAVKKTEEEVVDELFHGVLNITRDSDGNILPDPDDHENANDPTSGMSSFLEKKQNIDKGYSGNKNVGKDEAPSQKSNSGSGNKGNNQSSVSKNNQQSDSSSFMGSLLAPVNQVLDSITPSNSQKNKPVKPSSTSLPTNLPTSQSLRNNSKMDPTTDDPLEILKTIPIQNDDDSKDIDMMRSLLNRMNNDF